MTQCSKVHSTFFNKKIKFNDQFLLSNYCDWNTRRSQRAPRSSVAESRNSVNSDYSREERRQMQKNDASADRKKSPLLPVPLTPLIQSPSIHHSMTVDLPNQKHMALQPISHSPIRWTRVTLQKGLIVKQTLFLIRRLITMLTLNPMLLTKR